MKVLIADDTPENLRLLRATLEGEGIDVFAARDGVEALDLLRTTPVDAIIADLLMPRMDGYRLCYEVRRTEHGKLIPLMLYTATDFTAGGRRLASQMGADKLIEKPATASAIVAALRELTTESRYRLPRSVAAVPPPGDDTWRSYNDRLIEKLRASEEEFRQLAEAMPQIVWITRPDGWNTFFNRQWMDYTGLTLEESLGDGWNKPFHPDDRQRAWDAWRHATTEIGIYSLECRLRRADGAYQWWLIRGVPVRDAGGAILKWFGTCTDIDELKIATEKLRASEEFNRRIVESSSDCIKVLDLDGRLLSMSEGGQRLLEIKALQRYLNTCWISFWNVDDQPRVRAAVAAARAGNSGRFQAFCASEAGSPRWWDVIITPIRDGEGRLHQLLAISRDITAQHQADAALKSIEWMLTNRPAAAARGAIERAGQPYDDVTALNTERTILDAVGRDLLADIVGDYMNLLETSSAVYEKNGDYAFGIFSSGWCQTMDFASFRGCGTSDARAALCSGKWHCHESCWTEASRQSIVTKQPTDIPCAGGIRLHAVPIYAGDEIVGSINFGYGEPPRDPAVLQELAAKYGVAVEELQRHAATYERRPPFIIELAKQRLLGSARLIGEIVQRKRAERRLRELNATLEQRVAERTAELTSANRELESFAYSVSHDLRAPLRGIDGWSHALLEDYGDKLDERGRDYIAQVCGEAQRMGKLIDDLLDLSRVTRAELHRDPVDLSALAHEIVAGLRQHEARRRVDVTIAPGISATGDEALLRLVLENLLGNAWKFTSKKPDARIEFGAATALNPQLSTLNSEPPVFFVRDNGAGFAMTHAAKLFAPFQRLHRTSEFPGTGIGLATVQRIVQRHGGKVWAEAERDRGATFFFTLPPLTTSS